MRFFAPPAGPLGHYVIKFSFLILFCLATWPTQTNGSATPKLPKVSTFFKLVACIVISFINIYCPLNHSLLQGFQKETTTTNTESNDEDEPLYKQTTFIFAILVPSGVMLLLCLYFSFVVLSRKCAYEDNDALRFGATTRISEYFSQEEDFSLPQKPRRYVFTRQGKRVHCMTTVREEEASQMSQSLPRPSFTPSFRSVSLEHIIVEEEISPIVGNGNTVVVQNELATGEQKTNGSGNSVEEENKDKKLKGIYAKANAFEFSDNDPETEKKVQEDYNLVATSTTIGHVLDPETQTSETDSDPCINVSDDAYVIDSGEDFYPKAKGSDIIKKDIIENLAQAESSETDTAPRSGTKKVIYERASNVQYPGERDEEDNGEHTLKSSASVEVSAEGTPVFRLSTEAILEKQSTDDDECFQEDDYNFDSDEEIDPSLRRKYKEQDLSYRRTQFLRPT
eukprot:m.44077 g.44077  ORF g.44077 m.44077 type:complete len:452 (-) comp10045_c0_seq2:117-1472(-)